MDEIDSKGIEFYYINKDQVLGNKIKDANLAEDIRNESIFKMVSSFSNRKGAEFKSNYSLQYIKTEYKTTIKALIIGVLIFVAFFFVAVFFELKGKFIYYLGAFIFISISWNVRKIVILPFLLVKTILFIFHKNQCQVYTEGIFSFMENLILETGKKGKLSSVNHIKKTIDNEYTYYSFRLKNGNMHPKTFIMAVESSNITRINNLEGFIKEFFSEILVNDFEVEVIG